jgi:hypothetical protein
MKYLIVIASALFFLGCVTANIGEIPSCPPDDAWFGVMTLEGVETIFLPKGSFDDDSKWYTEEEYDALPDVDYESPEDYGEKLNI